MTSSGINSISTREVFDFKERFCDENGIIARLLQHELSADLVAPILDVGAGIGDIAYNALANKEVVLLDPNVPTKEDYPIRPLHRREVGSFFDYAPETKPRTLLISHTLQFLDEDLGRLNSALFALHPERVVIIRNANDDIMGELVQWALTNFPDANPEVAINGFPVGYFLQRSTPFKANLVCPDFPTFAKQIAYLMLIDLRDKENELISFLKERLGTPRFSFNQTIDTYIRS